MAVLLKEIEVNGTCSHASYIVQLFGWEICIDFVTLVLSWCVWKNFSIASFSWQKFHLWTCIVRLLIFRYLCCVESNFAFWGGPIRARGVSRCSQNHRRWLSSFASQFLKFSQNRSAKFLANYCYFRRFVYIFVVSKSTLMKAKATRGQFSAVFKVTKPVILRF